ncbi:Uncharacterised protein [Mycobacteroides abscessus subsp. abscessus]|uniref:DNA/RNA non-specific endonuclease n=1 Tax=Mycobacteroides abscessus TaxID=36809 RepID=UPI0009294503|nr:DNA/RNA non-specific endonuclease [Mycobacteroides abscessus]SIL60294.1 Uncharacterised protein [Mycobacteroides abscessus subsp. abscessus]
MTTLDEFMAINPNAYMAVVDTWRPQTRQFKEAYDDYKRWAGSPAGTEWTGRTSNAAYETASTDCHGSDNADDTVEEGGKLIGATIEYEVLPNLTGGQNLIERVLAHAEQGVSIDQNFNMTYTPAEGESDESIARNREHVKESERQVKEHVAKWEKGCQTLKGQAEATAQSITGCINPKTALVDGRKVLRDAVAPKPGDGTATAIDYKKQYPKDTDPAGTTPAAASNPETINYKELYPKTASVDGHQLGSIGAMPGVGDIDKTKPAKLAPTLADRDVPAFAQATRERLQHEGVPANQIEQRVNDAVQRAQSPRFAPDADPMRTPGQVPLHNSPGDQFNDIVGRANDEATKTIDGQIEQAKVLTGQAGPGAPGVAEAWKDVGLGAVKQVHELTSDPLAAPRMGIEQSKEFYNHPGEFIGKNLIHGTEALGGGAIGGEAAAGARGLLGDLTGTEGRAITHGLDDASPGHHTPTQVEHHTATGDHGASGPHTPDLNHVSTESGGPGGWNQELNKPAPNTHYTVDDQFRYTTDDLSRVGHAHADLDANSAGDRNGYQQRIAGGPDRLPGDEGGHIFGTQFGGPGEAINITAMRDTLNSVGNREYYNLEGDWRSYISEGKQVSVDVEITYPGDSRRPAMYSVTTYVNGNLDSVHSFRN